MSNDISYKYTKTQNKECGRNGYYLAHREKCTAISPSEYGMFLQQKRKRNRGK